MGIPISAFLRGLPGISTLFLLASCEVSRYPMEPAPWTAHAFTAPDGSEFAYTAWVPETRPRAIIMAIHGLGGAASDWRPLGEHLRSRGYAIYAHELRGMGNDPRPTRVGRLDRRSGWMEDFASFTRRVKMEHPGVPVFWYGESLGGIIGTRMLDPAEGTDLLPEGFILASPIVQVEGKLPPWKEMALRLGALLAPGLRIDLQSLAPEDVPPAQVVSTTTHERQLLQTPHAVSRFSLRTLEVIRRLVLRNHRAAPEITLPVLVLYAGHDVFTAPGEVENFFARLGSPEKESHFYPEGYHLLLHDVGSPAILAEIERWLEKTLRARSKPDGEPPKKPLASPK